MAITTMLEDERVLNPDGSDAHRVVLLVNQDVGDSVELTGANVPGLNDDDVIATGSVLITPSANYIAFADGKFAMKSNSGGSALPAVTSADNGKVLSVVDGAWAADDKRFVVTCTPTAADYSGTMDKTIGEIRSAYDSGKEIWFKEAQYSVPISSVSESTNGNDFIAYMILDANNLLVVLNVAGPDDDRVYSTNIFQLTPMGS